MSTHSLELAAETHVAEQRIRERYAELCRLNYLSKREADELDELRQDLIDLECYAEDPPPTWWWQRQLPEEDFGLVMRIVCEPCHRHEAGVEK